MLVVRLSLINERARKVWCGDVLGHHKIHVCQEKKAVTHHQNEYAVEDFRYVLFLQWIDLCCY